jgi:pyruvate-formate lyase-activating enzyme
MNNDIYQKYTGSDNALVKQNLHQLIKSVPSEKLHIRVPIIKGFNTEDDVRKSVSELNKMGLLNIEIFKYTSKGESIYGKNQS